MWVITDEERDLYSTALAFGADHFVLSTKSSSAVFVETKEKKITKGKFRYISSCLNSHISFFLS